MYIMVQKFEVSKIDFEHFALKIESIGSIWKEAIDLLQVGLKSTDVEPQGGVCLLIHQPISILCRLWL